jgi:hypothetical protein
VAAGRYTPDRDAAGLATPFDRDASFVLVDGIALRGGYAGIGSPNPDARDVAAYVTVLSGDLRGNDVGGYPNSDNSRHIVSALGVGACTVLEGVTVAGAYAHATAPDVLSRSGGGIYSSNASLRIERCVFRGCYASWYGGAVYHSGAGTITIVSCYFEQNTSDRGGAVFVGESAQAEVRHCTIVRNFASDRGGGLHLGGGDGGGIGLELHLLGESTLLRCLHSHAGGADFRGDGRRSDGGPLLRPGVDGSAGG